MPFGRYTLLTIPGSLAWAFAFAGIGWAFGSNYERFHHAFDLALLAGAALLVLYLVVRQPHLDSNPVPSNPTRRRQGPVRAPDSADHGADAEVLDSGTFILGPNVKAFEAEAAAHLGVPRSVGVANGTDALVLALDAMNIGPGDEVICPSFTFYATAESIARRGATRSSRTSTR